MYSLGFTEYVTLHEYNGYVIRQSALVLKKMSGKMVKG